jgi:hypothetical protein
LGWPAWGVVGICGKNLKKRTRGGDSLRAASRNRKNELEPVFFKGACCRVEPVQKELDACRVHVYHRIEHVQLEK